jgi:sirohydrochlorin cobaltochelatase
MGKAVILLGHGSRDPLWRQPIEAVAARLAQRHPGTPSRCAYMELQQPDLAQVARELVAGGATQVTVVPMFLGTGKHARTDMPILVAELRATYPEVTFELRPPVGEDTRVLDLLASIALE